MKVSKYIHTRRSVMIRFLRGYVSILRVSIVHAFEYCSRRWSNVLFFLK